MSETFFPPAQRSNQKILEAPNFASQLVFKVGKCYYFKHALLCPPTPITEEICDIYQNVNLHKYGGCSLTPGFRPETRFPYSDIDCGEQVGP